jgi:DNA-binding NtrC family response regulator
MEESRFRTNQTSGDGRLVAETKRRKRRQRSSAEPTGWGCLVTNDEGLEREVAEALQPEFAGDVCCISTADWLKGRLPVGRPRWVVLDLRTAGGWADLAQLCSRTAAPRLTEGAPWVGLLDRGVPREYLTLAGRVLSAGVCWPRNEAALPAALARAERGFKAQPRIGSHDLRTLEGTQRSFVTATPALFSVVDQLAVAARHRYNVLVTGETGTGKTTLAKLLHEVSPRRDRRFLVISCGALPSDLMGSELFGHMKGAFTSAEKTKVGKFECADGGTVVLEEIDTLDLVQQAKLLRVLETGEFEPVGSNETRKVDVRVIVTSNIDLAALVKRDEFRADLYFRLKQLELELPPLRQRPRDIVWLTDDIIRDCCRETGLDVEFVEPELVELLLAHQWPGNIRDLQNELHRAVLFCRDGILTPNGLSSDVVREARRQIDQGPGPTGLVSDVEQTEIAAIERMLRATDFNRSAAARALGISRVTLYNKIRKYNIRLDDRRET